jgi:hypothetical protein
LKTNKLYKDKLFYEVIKKDTSEYIVVGPLPGIRYLSNGTGFAQIVRGKVVQKFDEDDILVTKKALVGHL